MIDLLYIAVLAYLKSHQGDAQHRASKMWLLNKDSPTVKALP